MDTTSETSANTVKVSSKAARGNRGPSRTTQPAKNRLQVLLFLLLPLALCIGVVLGVLYMRQRYHAQDIVVSVNGVSITKNEFYRRLELAAGTTTIRQMVDEELRVQLAKKEGVAPTPQQLDKSFREMSGRSGYKETLARTGQTEEEVKRSLLVGLSATAVVNKGVKVSDEELHTFYNRNIDKANPNSRYYTPETVHIAVILNRKESECKKALSEYQSGAPWGKVVGKYSQDQSKQNAGEIPPITKGRNASARVPGLEETVFGMKIGDILGPKKFAGAYWIIRCLDKKAEKTLKFDEVAEDCRVQAMLTKGVPANTKNVEEEYQKFQKEAKIQAFWEQYKQALTLK